MPSRRFPGNTMPGLSDGVFMTSRDGLVFRRWLEAWIRPGLQRERWVNRNNMTGKEVGRIGEPGHGPGELSHGDVRFGEDYPPTSASASS